MALHDPRDLDEAIAAHEAGEALRRGELPPYLRRAVERRPGANRRGLRGFGGGGGAALPTLAISGFVTSVDYYSSGADAASDIGADGCQWVVFRFASLPSAANKVLLGHGTTTAGHIIQQMNTRVIRCYQRGGATTSTFALSAADEGEIHSIVSLWSHGNGRSIYFDGIPIAGAALFSNTADPAAGKSLFLGCYDGGTIAASEYQILGAGQSTSVPDGAAILSWWESCRTAKQVQAFPGDVDRWTAVGLDVGTGTAPSPLSAVAGSADLSVTGAIDVVDVTDAAWGIVTLDSAEATAVTESASGTWTGTPKIMLAGDSITVGTGATGGNAWRNVFADTLTAASLGYDLVGSAGTAPQEYSAVSGYSISQLDTLLQTDIGTYTPDVLLVLIGINNTVSSGDMQARIAEYESLLDNAITNGGASMYIVCGTVGIRTDSWLGEQNRYALNSAIRRLVKEKADAGSRVYLVETADDYGSGDLADTIHPNDTGHAALGASFVGACRAVLNGVSF